MILLTGGLGYIGSHTAVELLSNNYDVVIIDNLSNSKIETKSKIETIAGKTITFYKGDVRDAELLNKIFLNYQHRSKVKMLALGKPIFLYILVT